MKLIQTRGNLFLALVKCHHIPVRLYIGFVIRRLRELFGKTQGILARQAEANLSYISSFESGINNISIKKILQVCNALQLESKELIIIQDNFSRASCIGNTLSGF